MMSRIRMALVAGAMALACSSISRSGESAAVDAPSSARQMSQAAQQLLAALSPAQRATANAPLSDEMARTNWSNLPSMFVSRGGLRLGSLDDNQRGLVHALLRASTSSQGYQKVAGIMRLDDLLSEDARAMAARGASTIPQPLQKELFDSWSTENYWIRVFGDPARDANWGWLITGHHLAASFTVAGRRVGFTPLFLGAEPDVVQNGRYAGWRPLSHEAERGFDLMQTLNATQRTRAVLAGEIPTDVLAGPGRRESLVRFEGLKASDMSMEQQTLLWRLIEEYIGDADFDAAEAQRAKIRADGPATLHFAWMGPVDDPTQRHYYRVHGPSILIEFTVERGVGGSAANHVHSIARDPANDYGEDWLGLHYRESHNPAFPGGPPPAPAPASAQQ